MSSDQQSWEQLRMDPDPESDLGYESSEWDVLPVETGGRDQRLFLPADEDALRDDAFIVADATALCDVRDCR
ncbi:hypothetical protein SAMN06269185_1558 [Natronoarchaeum philippinense]|uniref:Uncharacterized protein n=1 Tax=Natronoarchaeum philippinense TaxID=558529 RepID=A0A285NTI6_NATPI|nr:hypothetical protein [Natronoarchaeum philippinense]SNZ12223.1 hypothetical protein SAMN06269185_1558 [Natronoarchaeum philippinense]